ncbi:MAG: formate dehydrogenase accessory protein FdhE [Nitrospirota bacterium]
MVIFYKGLIDIWSESSPDDLSILFSDRLTYASPLLDTGRINDVDFTNSIDAAKKVFKLFEKERKGDDIECAGASSEAVIEFIREGLHKNDRFRNAVLKWILKPSFEYTQLPLPPRGGGTGWGGQCPLCASPANMAIVYTPENETSEHRLLSCCFCGYRWRYPLTGCPSCGNEKPERFGFFVGDSARDQCVRAVSCEECKTYLKTVFIGCRSDKKRPADLDMDIEDVATLHIDMMANQRGYTNCVESRVLK